MSCLLISLALFFGGGIGAVLVGRDKAACLIGSISALAASLIGLIPAAQTLAAAVRSLPYGTVTDFGPLPVGRILLQPDALSAFFLVPTLAAAGLCAMYGASYLMRSAEKSDHGPRRLGAQWLFYNLLAGGMVLMLTAADAFLFLLAWEIMSLSPLFLISLHDEQEQVRTASWIYLAAAHLGALCLLALFALLSGQSDGGLSFASFAEIQEIRGAGGLFLLALLGFGTKAGLMPMHVWLPEAHPAAPSHVSAFMSGAMINAGVYGLFRILGFLGPPQVWWAYALIGLGAASALIGILLALVQQDIKRSLAYSSVENMGIIHMAAGFGIFAAIHGDHGLGAVFFTGALLHLLNHSLSKSLLFLSVGSVLSATGSVSLRRLGGLQKRMPVVGLCFALGAVAIAALPPLNGFAGEFLMYVSLASGGAQSSFTGLMYWAGLIALALTGGFTLMCFARLYGLAFLGEARSEEARSVVPAPLPERLPLLALCLLCLISAAISPPTAALIAQTVIPCIGGIGAAVSTSAAGSVFVNSSPAMPLSGLSGIVPYDPLWSVNGVFLLFSTVLGLLVLLRRRLLRGRSATDAPTWDCGYAAPSERMQYSGVSFAQPAAVFMRVLIRGDERLPELQDYFPTSAKASAAFPDRIKDNWYRVIFLLLLGVANWSKRMQHGRVNGYILYVLITLVALLTWKIGLL